MPIVDTEKRRKILDAFFQLAKENPSQNITLDMIAKKVKMRRESIYKYHFDNKGEMIDMIRHLVDEEIYSEFKKYISKNKFNISTFLEEVILPTLYEKRDWLKVLFQTNLDSDWQRFLIGRYCPLIENYLNKMGKKEILSNNFLARLVVKKFLNIVATWLTEEHPEPVSLFKEKFVYIYNLSLSDILTDNSEEE